MGKKYQFGFTVIVMDIDFFKHVNDTYGHPAGDEVLRQFTEKIAMNIRKEDTLSRYGGEEFAVLLHKTTEDYGRTIAEKLLNIIRSTGFQVDGHTIDITISIGLVQYSDDYENFDHMMKVADQALYKAKNNGRDQIFFGKVGTE